MGPVFLLHARVPGFGAGFFGVDLFFVLSGFLITDLVLAEIGRSGTVDLPRFLWRRVLRLVPALAVFVALAPRFPETLADAALQALVTLAFVSDYTAALAATLWRIDNVWFVAGWDITYYRFDTRLSGLLVGAALAALVRSWSGCLVELAVVGRRWLGWLGHPLLAWIGRLSYGIYLWHYPVIRGLRSEMDWPGGAGLGFVVSLGLAWLSYVTVEALARRRRPVPVAA